MHTSGKRDGDQSCPELQNLGFGLFIVIFIYVTMWKGAVQLSSPN